MALPAPAIEQLSSHRRSSATQGWFGQLLLFAAFLFAITLVVYLGLIFGYKPYINAQVKDLDEQIKKFALDIPVEDQRNTMSFYAQLVNLRSLLDSHVALTPLFTWLETHTMPGVYYTRFALAVPNRQLILAGVARSMEEATGQLQVFQHRPEIERFTFNTIRFDTAKNGWEFEATIAFKASFFSQAEAAAGAVTAPVDNQPVIEPLPIQ